MKYLFIPSYPSIFFAIKCHNDSDGNVCIITTNNSVARLLESLKIRTIKIKSIDKPYHVFAAKTTLDHILSSKNKDDEFYLLDNIFCVEGFYLAAKWPSKHVFYKNLSREFELNRGKNKKHSIRFKIGKLLIESWMKIKLTARIKSDYPVLAIDEGFIEKYNIKKLNLEVDYQSISKEVIIKNQIKTEKYDYLFVSQGMMNDTIISSSFLSLLEDEVLNLESLASKPHPRHSFGANLTLPNPIADIIPSEFILGNIHKAVISVFSLTLINATWFDNVKIISLLELVEWKDRSYKESIKEMLTSQGDGRIQFPKTIPELRKMLKS